MNILVILLIILLCCGSVGFVAYPYGPPYVAGGGLVTVLLVLLVLKILGVI